MKCDKCGNRAVIFRRHSGAHLCRHHFIESIERRIKHNLRKQFQGNRLAVAVSGGKDSLTLLYMLSEIFEKRRDIELFVITIDEGIKGYRDESLKVIDESCRSSGLSLLL